MQPEKIEITTSTLLKALLIILGIVLIWYLKSVLALLFIVLIFIAALAPVVDWAEKYKIPRLLSTIIIYLIILGLIALVSYLIIPPLVNQIIQFINDLPNFVEKYAPYLQRAREFSSQSHLFEAFTNDLTSLSQNLESVSESILTAAIRAFGGITSFVIAVVLIFYLLLAKKEIAEGILSYTPKKRRNLIKKIGGEILFRLGSWARGQFLLCLIIGVIDTIALSIIGVPFALLLGLFSGITELIPSIGPILGAIPAIIVAWTISPWKALIVAIVYLVVQQLEGNILVPNIMKKAVGMNPALIIIAILIGAELGGILGMFLAVPIASVIVIILRVWREETIEKKN